MYISRVEEGSIAERSGLRPGDTILEVNGTPFTSIGHEEALKVNIDFCSNGTCRCFSRGNSVGAIKDSESSSGRRSVDLLPPSSLISCCLAL